MRLRWELSKIWHRPITDPIFSEITHLQWLTYAAFLSQDKREEAEVWRDRIEYMARFIDNKAVEQIQASRDRAKTAKEIGIDTFEEVLQRNFGRGRGVFSKVEQMKVRSVQDIGKQIDQVDEIRVVKGAK